MSPSTRFGPPPAASAGRSSRRFLDWLGPLGFSGGRRGFVATFWAAKHFEFHGRQFMDWGSTLSFAATIWAAKQFDSINLKFMFPDSGYSINSKFIALESVAIFGSSVNFDTNCSLTSAPRIIF